MKTKIEEDTVVLNPVQKDPKMDNHKKSKDPKMDNHKKLEDPKMDNQKDLKRDTKDPMQDIFTSDNLPSDKQLKKQKKRKKKKRFPFPEKTNAFIIDGVKMNVNEIAACMSTEEFGRKIFREHINSKQVLYVIDSGSQIHLIPDINDEVFREYKYRPSKIRIKQASGAISKALGELHLEGHDDVIVMAGGANYILSLYQIVCNGWQFCWDFWGGNHNCQLIHKNGERIDCLVVNELPVIPEPVVMKLLSHHSPGKITEEEAGRCFHTLLEVFDPAKRSKLDETYLNRCYFTPTIPEQLRKEYNISTDVLNKWDLCLISEASNRTLPDPFGRYVFDGYAKSSLMYCKRDFKYQSLLFNHTANTWHEYNVQKRTHIGSPGDILISFYNLKDLPVINCNLTTAEPANYEIPDGDFSDYDEEEFECLMTKLADGDVHVVDDGGNGWTEHDILHHPYKPGCEVCRLCKSNRKRGTRGKVMRSSKDDSDVLITLDLHGPLIASRERNTYLAVCRNERDNTFWCQGIKSRHKSCLQSFLATALRELNPDKKKIVLHSDRERSVICSETEAFVLNHGVTRLHYGTANHHNSNSLGELAIKRCVNAIRTLLCGSRVPLNCWDWAATCWSRCHNASVRPDAVPEIPRIPFGCAGTVMLPKDGYRSSKLHPKRIPAVWLGPVHDSSNSSWILFYNEKAKRFSHTSVMNRDCEWGSDFGFSREVIDLQQVDRWIGINPDGERHLVEYAEDESDRPTITTLLAESSLNGCASMRTENASLFDLWSYYLAGLQDITVIKAHEADIPKLSRSCVTVLVNADGSSSIVPPHRAIEMRKEADLIVFRLARVTPAIMESFAELDQSDSEEEKAQQKLDDDITKKCKDAIRQRQHNVSARSSTRLMEKKLREQARLLKDNAKAKSTFYCTAKQLYNIMRERVCFIAQPVTKKEALEGPDKEKWQVAIDAEWQVMDDFGVFLAPEERAAVMEKHGSKVIFVPAVMPLVIKGIEQSDPKLRRLKARLCAAGNRLRDVFGRKVDGNSDGLWSAPASLPTFRLVSMLAGRKDYDLQACDLDGAYLQSTLPGSRIYYMEISSDLLPTKWREKARKLKSPCLRIVRSLYGLEESGHVWANHASDVLQKIGYKRCMDSCEPSLFVKRVNGKMVVLLLYVDDVLLCAPKDLLPELWDEIRQVFRMKKTEAATLYVGVGIERKEDGSVSFNQEEYIKKLVSDFKLDTSKKASTPMTVIPEPDASCSGKYATTCRRWIGSLLFLMRGSRPDIGFAVNVLGRRVTKWGKQCDAALERLMQYIYGTSGLKLQFNPINVDDLKVVIHCDSDFAGCKETRKSTSGIAIYIESQGRLNLIEWQSKLQSAISLSTGEAEIAAIVKGIHKGLKVAMTLEELLEREVEIEVHSDATVAVAAMKSGYSSKLYHMARTHGVNLSWCKEFFTSNEKHSIHKIHTDTNTSDVFTKPLDEVSFTRHRSSIGLGQLNQTNIKDSFFIEIDNDNIVQEYYECFLVLAEELTSL